MDFTYRLHAIDFSEFLAFRSTLYVHLFLAVMIFEVSHEVVTRFGCMDDFKYALICNDFKFVLHVLVKSTRIIRI